MLLADKNIIYLFKKYIFMRTAKKTVLWKIIEYNLVELSDNIYCKFSTIIKWCECIIIYCDFDEYFIIGLYLSCA